MPRLGILSNGFIIILMSEVLARVKNSLHFIQNHFGKIVGGLLGMFWAKDAFAFFVGIALGAQFDIGLRGDSQKKFSGIDKFAPKKRTLFIRTFFNIMGHIAKADGRVSPEEIEVAEALMTELKLTTKEKKLAQRSFTDGKNPDFPLASSLQTLYKAFRFNISLREWFVRLQIQVALASDGLSGIVTNLLMATAGQLDIPGSRVSDLIREARIHNAFTTYGNRKKKGNYYQRQKQGNYSRYENSHDEKFSSHSRQRRARSASPARNALLEAYIVLGVSAADTTKDITRAYRRLLSQNHPDKVIGQGGSSAERERANKKTIEIRKAYELIKERRNF